MTDEKPKISNPWKWVLFYYDPADPRVMVPKRIPIFGWTINFGQKISWLIIAPILVIIIWAAFTGHTGIHLP